MLVLWICKPLVNAICKNMFSRLLASGKKKLCMIAASDEPVLVATTGLDVIAAC
jgi:hypothetical protein